MRRHARCLQGVYFSSSPLSFRLELVSSNGVRRAPPHAQVCEADEQMKDVMGVNNDIIVCSCVILLPLLKWRARSFDLALERKVHLEVSS